MTEASSLSVISQQVIWQRYSSIRRFNSQTHKHLTYNWLTKPTVAMEMGHTTSSYSLSFLNTPIQGTSCPWCHWCQRWGGKVWGVSAVFFVINDTRRSFYILHHLKDNTNFLPITPLCSQVKSLDLKEKITSLKRNLTKRNMSSPKVKSRLIILDSWTIVRETGTHW